MDPSTGDAYVDELLSYLQTLPPSVNPYSAAIAWLSEKLSPPTLGNTYQRVTIAFACIYGLQFLGLTGTTIILLAGEGRWIVRRTSDGFWQPNPKLTSAIVCAAFCGCHTATLIRQVLITAGRIGARNQTALLGMRWVPLVIGAWLFAHACIRNIFVTRRKIKLFMIMGSEYKTMSALRRRISSEWPIWAVNILGAAIPTAGITVDFTAFALSNKYQNRLIDQSRSLAVQLATAASAYQPATFQPQDLSPFFDMIRNIERTQANGDLWWRIGMGSLAVLLLIIMTIFIPFFIHHLALLKGLVGARAFWRAFMLDFESVPATLSVSAVASRSQRERGYNGPPVLPSIDILLGQRNISLSTDGSSEERCEWDGEAIPPKCCGDKPLGGPEMISHPPNVSWQPQPSTKPTAPERTRLRRQDPEDVDLRAEYRRLILSGLALWTGQFVYLPTAIWATVGSLRSAALNEGEVWLTNLASIPTALMVPAVLAYVPAWRQIHRWIRRSHRR